MAKKKQTKSELRDSAEKVFLAGLGALAAAEEEGSRAFKTLVAKGERYQKTLRKPVDRARQRMSGTVNEVRGRAGKTWQKVEDVFDHQVTAALHRIGVPSQKEVAALTRRVQELTRKLEVISPRTATGRARSAVSAKKKVASKKKS
jgi:poly(hydroxyalkanoate) granule-associated protein